ncbi:6905_t:CDS:10 [Gigaspora rosea]|nr:6905_t:CDS:10 [Gigaspora rosea]
MSENPCHEGHRKYFKDVDIFWKQIERCHAKGLLAQLCKILLKSSKIPLQVSIPPSRTKESKESNDNSKCFRKKINKGKQSESKATERYDDRSSYDLALATMMTSSLNSISNNVTISHDSSTMINQEQLPTAIVTNPATQTLPLKSSVNNANIQVTPQKSVLFKESVTYLQNHIKLNVNDQGMIIKDNHMSIKIPSIIRNWLITALSSTSEGDKKFNQQSSHFIEVSGGPENTDLTHVKEDAEKLLKEAVFGLVSLLRNHLDKSAEVAKSLYTFTIQKILLGDQMTFGKLCLINKHVYSFSQIKSARLPFEFGDVAVFLETFELLYIIISELEIQTSVINKLKLPKIRDWIWVPDSVSAWKCKDDLDKNS